MEDICGGGHLQWKTLFLVEDICVGGRLQWRMFQFVELLFDVFEMFLDIVKDAPKITFYLDLIHTYHGTKGCFFKWRITQKQIS